MSDSSVESIANAVRDYARKNVISVKDSFVSVHGDKVKNPWALDLLISFMSQFVTKPMMVAPGATLEDLRAQDVESKVTRAQPYIDLFYKIPTVKKHFHTSTTLNYKGASYDVEPHVGFLKALESGAHAMAIVEQRIALEASILRAHAGEHNIQTHDTSRLVQEHILTIEPYGSVKNVQTELYTMMGNLEHLMYNAHVASTALRNMATSGRFRDRATKTALNVVLQGIFIERRRHDPISKGKINLAELPDDIELFDQYLYPEFFKFEREYANTRCKNVYGKELSCSFEAPRSITR